jgi:IclR family acetate operon transcriptional repressor
MTAVERHPEQQRSALMKGLHVLESVASHHRLSDIAATTGLSVSTVHRILTDLVENGWVEQDAGRQYRPGVRVHGLVSLLHNDEEIVRRALPHLRALRDRTGFTVHMARYGRENLVYIAKIDGLGSYQMRSRVGDAIPLWSTAIGKAVLAALDERSTRELVAGATLERRTPATITSRRELLEQVDVIRSRGWSTDDGENELHTRCVGVALRDASGRVIGGVSLSGLDHEMTLETAADLAPRVSETGRSIERQLRPAG